MLILFFVIANFSVMILLCFFLLLFFNICACHLCGSSLTPHRVSSPDFAPSAVPYHFSNLTGAYVVSTTNAKMTLDYRGNIATMSNSWHS